MSAEGPPDSVTNDAGFQFQVGTRVVMTQGKRWQGVGTISRVHDNGTTCAVKWDSGRLDRSLLINDLIVKVVGGTPTPSKPVSDAPATPASTPGSAAQTPSSQDKSYTPAATPAPPAKGATPSPSPSPQPAKSPAAPAEAPSTSAGTGKEKASGGGMLVPVVGLAVVVGAVAAFAVMKKK